jgi:tetratricopeptide (TPR) repeat protein
MSWIYWGGAVLAVILVFGVYGPSMAGPFVFDDSYLPMNVPGFAQQPLSSWIGAVRPVLMFSYWLNLQLSGFNTYSYHALNVLLHLINGLLLYLIVRRIVAWTNTWSGFAWLAAGVFLLHPMQAESVAYIAGRSELVAALFYFGGFALFLYRRSNEVTWGIAVAVMALFALALGSKEHAITLPVLLLVTDYYFNPGFRFEGIRKNWRLYAPIVILGVAGAAFVLKRIGGDTSAGFSTAGVTPLAYLFTQFRVIPAYIRLFYIPLDQSADYDVPLSQSLFDHGSVFGLVFLIVLLAAAIVLRKRFPLASYGFLIFLLLLAPTSSIMPIKDPMVDRRLYLPMIGLLLVTIEGLARLSVSRRTLATGLAVWVAILAALTYQRSQVWGDTIALWRDTVLKSPGKSRAHFQLAHALYSQGLCQESIAEYEQVSKLEKPDYRLLVDWGLAYVCANQNDAAIAKMEEAARLEPTAHVYSQIGMIYGKMGKAAEARVALDKARDIDPNYDMTYVYLGHLYYAEQQFDQARLLYLRALELNPNNPFAGEFLGHIQSRRQKMQQSQQPAISVTPQK